MNELRILRWDGNLSALSLFTSASTLLCCALPALLVSIGAGAVLAGLVSRVPQIVWLSEHKELLFVIAGLVLVLAGLLQWYARRLPCPIDASLAAQCQRTRQQARWLYSGSVFVFVIGALFAFCL